MEHSITLLTRGVVLDDGRLLLCRQVGSAHTFLPGGHVEFLESCSAALEREIEEELGVDCQVGRYLGAVEHQWFGPVHPGGASSDRHEIAHFFAVSLDGIGSGISPPSLENHLEFVWVDLDDLDRHNLRPILLRDLIQQLAAGDKSIWWGSSLKR